MSRRVGLRRTQIVLSVAAMTVAMLGGALALLEQAANASDNLACPSGTVEYKVDSNVLNGLSNGESALFVVNGQTFTFTKVAGPAPFVDDTFDFSSTIAVSVAYVKGGVDTNTYTYDPPATSGTGLHPPLTSGNQAPTISHVTFCVGTGTTTTSSSTTVPETSTTKVDGTTTSTTEGDTTTTVTATTTTSTVPETTTSTTEPATTTTLGEQGSTTTAASTSTTIVDGTTTSLPGTTTTLTGQGGTTTSTTEPVVGLGGPVPTTTTTDPTAPGRLPRTGSNSSAPLMIGLSFVAAGVLLLGRRRPWARSS